MLASLFQTVYDRAIDEDALVKDYGTGGIGLLLY